MMNYKLEHKIQLLVYLSINFLFSSLPISLIRINDILFASLPRIYKVSVIHLA